MARIGIDATPVFPAGKGISRTLQRTVEGLAALALPHELVAFVRSREAAALLEGCGVRCVPVRARPTLAWEQAGLARAPRRHRLDAVLTMTDRLPVVGRVPYVVWLFEVPTHRIEQNRLGRVGAYQRGSDLATAALWRGTVRRAALVLAGSEATAAEIRAAVPEASAFVRVVYPGLDEGFAPGPGPDGERYVLHLASSDPRDNTETALAAFAGALARVADPVRLLVVGGLGPRREAVEREARRLGLAGSVELRGRVSDEELAELYRGAAVYLDASLFEGFGYQPLEAMASGAPVVASNVTSIPEIVGDAGLLCDPRSSAELGDALVRVLERPELAGELRGRGLARAAAFTWERTAQDVAGALEEVLGRAR